VFQTKFIGKFIIYNQDTKYHNDLSIIMIRVTYYKSQMKLLVLGSIIHLTVHVFEHSILLSTEETESDNQTLEVKY
jgi:hypothetical protein